MHIDLYDAVRCDRCSGLLSALERAEYDDGEVAYKRVEMVHDRRLCDRILALKNEHWPQTLDF